VLTIKKFKSFTSLCSNQNSTIIWSSSMIKPNSEKFHINGRLTTSDTVRPELEKPRF